MIERTSGGTANRGHREVLSKEYPDEVIDRWKAGGKRWREFDTQLTMLGLRNDLTDSSRNALRSVFLGEKPAVFLESGDKLNRLRPIIEAAGLSITHGRRFVDDYYIYDPALVTDVVARNAESISNSSIPMSAIEIMESLARSSRGGNMRQRGLVLGFPHAAVEAFIETQGIGGLVGDRFYEVLSKPDRATYEAMFATYDKTITPAQKSVWLREKLNEYAPRAGITQAQLSEIDTKIDRESSWQLFGAHGFIWADYADSAESLARQQRIKDAFLVAGLAS